MLRAKAHNLLELGYPRWSSSGAGRAGAQHATKQGVGSQQQLQLGYKDYKTIDTSTAKY
jgi:hypothetical protein